MDQQRMHKIFAAYGLAPDEFAELEDSFKQEQCHAYNLTPKEYEQEIARWDIEDEDELHD